MYRDVYWEQTVIRKVLKNNSFQISNIDREKTIRFNRKTSQKTFA